MTIAPGVVLPGMELAELCRRYEVKELAVLGSAARGEMRPDSDIDLLVEFLPHAGTSLLRHFAAERELSQLLGRKVDLVSKRALRSRIRDEVLSQARLIYAARATLPLLRTQIAQILDAEFPGDAEPSQRRPVSAPTARSRIGNRNLHLC